MADPNSEKVFLTPDAFYADCWKLARTVFDSGYNPTWLMALWRGGTPPGMVLHEFFSYQGHPLQHIPIGTAAYHGIGQVGREVKINGLEHFLGQITDEDRLLIVDDVFDTGTTMDALKREIETKARKNTPIIKIATVWYKPEKNRTTLTPDFYINTTDQWIVFPHELHGLTPEEIKQKGGGIAELLQKPGTK